ncbi:MAG: DUF11 domain-containing protein [Acidobacteriia bacterium]|nr:DUF11 domain-containing protein [Terriglobia bacterium]
MNQRGENCRQMGRLLTGIEMAILGLLCHLSGMPGLMAQTPSADVVISSAASPNPAVTASNFDYIVSISNRGPAAAPNVILTIPMPADTSFRSLTAPSDWACATPPVGVNITITCLNQSLRVGGPSLIVLTLAVGCVSPDGANLFNSATIGPSSSDPNAFIDPDFSNNQTTALATVSNPTQITPVSRTFTSSGGDSSVDVTTPSICPWTAVSSSPFVIINSGTEGTGNGSVGFAVLPNSGATSRTARLTIAGLLFTLTQTAPGVGNSQINLLLPASGAATASTTGTDGTLHTGYATLDLSSNKAIHGGGGPNAVSAPYGIAVFRVTQNGVVVSEVGVPASPPTTDAQIFVDYRLGVATKSGSEQAGTLDINTGVAIVNTGSSQANVFFDLNSSNGALLAFGGGVLLPGTHIAKFINQLSDFAAGFVLPPNFPTDIKFGVMEIFSDQPVSVLALRQTTNQRGDSLFTTTPVADLTKPLTAGRLFFPQLADGGGFTTSVILMNPSDATEAGIVQILDNNGAPLGVHRVGDPAGSNSTFTYSIPPFAAFVLSTDGSPSVINTGSIQVTPGIGTNTPVGQALVTFTQAGILVTESGVSPATPTTHAHIFIDQSDGHDTGLALASPSSVPFQVKVTAFQPDGAIQLGSGVIDLKGNGHDAKFINEIIPTLPAEFVGVLDVSSPVPYVALTLRALTNARGDFLLTTFPIADANAAAPAPIIFPQIADGGGFRTEFILLNTAGSTVSTLNLFSDDGAPLSFAKQFRANPR